MGSNETRQNLSSHFFFSLSLSLSLDGGKEGPGDGARGLRPAARGALTT